jgi:hypothetical protein
MNSDRVEAALKGGDKYIKPTATFLRKTVHNSLDALRSGAIDKKQFDKNIKEAAKYVGDDEASKGIAGMTKSYRAHGRAKVLLGAGTALTAATAGYYAFRKKSK